MNSSNNTHPMSLEDLPIEIFLQTFAFLPLPEIVTAFVGLNSYIDSIARSVRDVSHVVRYNDVDALNHLHLFSVHIARLVIVNVEMADFMPLRNLRSLTLKCGTKTQLNIIRPQHFPFLGILHIKGIHRTATDSKEAIDNLLQVLLSNGFLRLRICTVFDVGAVSFCDTWTGSPTLRTLNLWMKTPLDCAQLRFVCPRLRRLTTYQSPMQYSSTVNASPPRNKRLYSEMTKLECLEIENKLIIDVNPLASFGNRIVPSRFNNTTITSCLNATHMFTFQVRILPQTEPYCRASFLIRITLPPEYPFKEPEISFLDPIYHPKVDLFGKHCCCWGLGGGYERFKPTTPLTEIITNVIRIIDNISKDDGHVGNCECFQEYLNDYQTFYKKALEVTLSYGRPRY